MLGKSCTDAILPGTGQDCISLRPNCLLPDISKGAELVVAAFDAEAGTENVCGSKPSSELSRTQSAPDLEVFGIERQFELGAGAGWVRSAAEEQPERTIFFPLPPEHEGARIYHSGHHARTKRTLRRLSELKPLVTRRSCSWSAHSRSKPSKSQLPEGIE